MTTHIPYLTIPAQVFASPAASILLPIALGTSVGYSSRQPQETYKQMRQPPLRPPPSVFGPVWTLLYGLTGYAAHRAVSAGITPLLAGPSGMPVDAAARASTARHAATLYSIQLGLNLAWMPLFFALRRPALALADNLSLLGLNAYIAYLFFGLDEVAGWLYVPYVAWLGFANYLNAGAGYLNGWDISDSTLATRAALGKNE